MNISYEQVTYIVIAILYDDDDNNNDFTYAVH